MYNELTVTVSEPQTCVFAVRLQGPCGTLQVQSPGPTPCFKCALGVAFAMLQRDYPDFASVGADAE